MGRQLKCGYKHCISNTGFMTKETAVKVGSRYYHPECKALSDELNDIFETYCMYFRTEDNYREHPYTRIRMEINCIVFELNSDKNPIEIAKQLNFTIRYAYQHNWKIKSPGYLRYWFDRASVKKAYGEYISNKSNTQPQADVHDSFDFDAEPVKANANDWRSFLNAT